MHFSVLLQIIPAFLAIMLIGYLGTRSGKLSADFKTAASYLVSNILLSASIFNSICGTVTELSDSQILHAILVIFAALVLCFAIGGAGALYAKRRGIDPSPFELCISIMNALLIGLPIIQEVYGPLAALYAGLFSTPMNLLLYSYGIWRLNSTGNHSGKGIDIKIIFSPCFVVTVAAVILFALRVQVPSVILQFTKYLGSATVPMSMIIIGALMASESLTEAFKDKRVYTLCFIRLILSPLIVWSVIPALTADIVLIRTVVILSACPCGMIIPIFALEYGHDPILSSRSVVVSTLFSMLTLPVWVYLIG